MWVLVVMVFTINSAGGSAIAIHEFKTSHACVAAKENLTPSRLTPKIHAFCVHSEHGTIR